MIKKKKIPVSWMILFFIAAIMITVLAVVSIAASNIVYCLMRRKHYGIMLANGMCKADIIWLIAMQNVIVMVLAAVAAWIVRLRAEFETLFPKKGIRGNRKT